jgi:DeoR/GlpR family transcriptional regulator of sugar metabolism
MNPDPLNSRQQAIIDLLREEGDVSVTVLSQRFAMTPKTIRRDLDYLEKQGCLTRTHGGALFTEQAKIQFAFSEKQEQQFAEKSAIARAAATLVQPGMSVVLDTGTTTLEVARAIAGIPRIRVVTSSLAIAAALFGRDNIDLVLLGGNVRKNSPDLTGPLTVDNLEKISLQLAIVGADALDRKGLSTSELFVASVTKAVMATAERTVLVADSSKFQRKAFVRFADWKRIDTVITDDRLSTEWRRWLKKAVGNIVFAPVTSEEMKHHVSRD